MLSKTAPAIVKLTDIFSRVIHNLARSKIQTSSKASKMCAIVRKFLNVSKVFVARLRSFSEKEIANEVKYKL